MILNNGRVWPAEGGRSYYIPFYTRWGSCVGREVHKIRDMINLSIWHLNQVDLGGGDIDSAMTMLIDLWEKCEKVDKFQEDLIDKTNMEIP